MSKVWNWIKSWWEFSQVSRQMIYIQKRINKLQKEKSKSDREIEIYQEKLNLVLKNTKQALDKAVGLNKKYEIEIEAIHEELTTAKEIVIPGLIAANKTFVDAWDAQSSNYAAMQAMSGSSKEMDT